MVHRMSYCPLCMGTGLDIDNNVCSCQVNVKSYYDAVSCLTIPDQYRGVAFNPILVPKDVHESYTKYLQEVHDNVTNMKWRYKNVLIASPIGHSKSILAYSCIEALFRNGVTTFPVYDVLEIKRIWTDLDLCRKPLYDVSNPEDLLDTPILFVKIPRSYSWEVFDTIAMILDRRVRRGHSTIFLYDGTYNQLAYHDKQNVLTGLVGNGSYNTLEVKSWDYLQETQQKFELDNSLG